MHMRSILLSIVLAVPAASAWAQTNPPDVTAGRTVIWHGPQGDMSLRASMLFPNADPHYLVFPFFIRSTRHVPVSSTGRVRISDTSPTLAVTGYGNETDWYLVKLDRHDGRDELRLPSRSPWQEGFFTDQPFEEKDLRGLTQSAYGDVYTLRPSEPLQPGAYLLCGKPGDDQGGWVRFCYDFEITGG